MSAPDQVPFEGSKYRLFPATRIVLVVWVILIGIMAVGILSQTSRGEGFDDLARFLGLFMAVIALLIVGAVALLIRRFATTQTSQVVAAVLAPPAVAVIALVITNWAI